jgi:hypothetical protein
MPPQFFSSIVFLGLLPIEWVKFVTEYSENRLGTRVSCIGTGLKSGIDSSWHDIIKGSAVPSSVRHSARYELSAGLRRTGVKTSADVFDYGMIKWRDKHQPLSLPPRPCRSQGPISHRQVANTTPCGQILLDAQGQISYSSSHKKRVLMKD